MGQAVELALTLPAGAARSGRHVAQAYARFADAMQTGTADTPDFDDAVVRHALIDAMERSHREGKLIKLA